MSFYRKDTSNKLCHYLFFLSLCVSVVNNHALYSSNPQNLQTTQNLPLPPYYGLHAHLLLQDPQSALQEWECLPLAERNSLMGQKMHVEILCAKGDLSCALQAWKEYLHTAPSADLLEHQELLEEMAWMVIRQTCRSTGLLTRALAILVSGVGNDSRGVQLLAEALCSPHVVLRKIAAEIAGQMRDDCLKEVIVERLTQERAWDVRQALLEAVGQMGISSLSDWLFARIEAVETPEEERAVCIEAYIQLHQRMEPQMLQRLLRASRSPLRCLACSLFIQYGDTTCLTLLEPLLEDPHPRVQAHALQALGLHSTQKERERLAGRAMPLLAHEDPEVALTSAWFLAPIYPLFALESIKKALHDPRPTVRHFAVGVLAKTGKRGLPLMEQSRLSEDPYVRVNAALGCLSLRHAVSASGDCLERALASQDRWMWHEEGIFRFVVPSTVSPTEDIPDYPEALNQLTRLEVLHHLAVVGHPYAQRAIKRFLQENVWTITGPLASIAIMEGDKEALEQVYLLQKDPNRRIRIQAALVLSLWGRDPRSIAVLEESYQGADHAMKGMILEAIARVGHSCSLPFLIRTLNEPSEQLRLLAAMAVLGCLQKS